MRKTWCLQSIPEGSRSICLEDCKATKLRILLAVFPLLVLLTRCAIAGPPFKTDDPIAVGLRHGEIYFFSSAVTDASGVVGIGPAFEFNYGPLPDLQLHLVMPLAFSKQTNGPLHTGYGDTELGVKYRFVHQTDLLPDIATFPLVEVPTGNAAEGLGNGKPQVYLPLWLQKDIGNWTVYGGGGYWINPGSGNRNWKFSGLLVQYNFTNDFFLGAEIFHQTPSTYGSPENTGLHLGGGIPVGDNTQLIFSADAGNGLTSYKHFSYYIGYYHEF